MPPLYDLPRRLFGYKYPRLGSLANRLLFSLLPKTIETELFPGIHTRLNSDDSTQRTTYWQGDRFEYPTAQILTQWATQGITHFFDIGANYGFFSCMMLSRFSEVKVNAFEPNPKTFLLLDSIRTDNHLTNLNTHPMGLSDGPGELFLHPGKEDSGHSTFGDHPELRGESETPIPVDTFDHWRDQVGIQLPNAPQWLAKIDVEGFELKVLHGMEKTLRAKAFSGMVIEINEFTLAFTGAKPAEVFAFMDQCGYEQPKHLAASDRNANAFFVPKI
jgi:FkbM family methyltransferase